MVEGFKPNKASAGYALFLAINATAVWGGVFPFLPMEVQTSEVMFWFFLAEALVFAIAFLASVVGSFFLPRLAKRFLVVLAAAPYLFGWVCLIGAIYLRDMSLQLATVGGGFLGLGSAGFYMFWQRLFAGTEPGKGTHDLIVGTAYASVIYFALYLIPRAITVFLVPLVFLPLFCLSIVLCSRAVDLDQPMFDDVPREHPEVYGRALHDVRRSALCLGGLGLCTGIMRAVAITEPATGSVVNIISMAASFIASVLIIMLWARHSIRINIINMYRIVFPIALTMFVVMPFVDSGSIRWLAGISYALNSVAILLMMIQCAQISRDRGVNPVFIYGFFGGIMYMLHDLGFISGTLANGAIVAGVSSTAVVALLAVYTISLLFLAGQKRGDERAAQFSDGNSIELVATVPTAVVQGETKPSMPAGSEPTGDLFEFDVFGAKAESDGMPVEDVLAGELPARRALAGETPAVDTSVEGMLEGEALVEEAPMRGEPAEGVPAGRVSAGQMLGPGASAASLSTAFKPLPPNDGFAGLDGLATGSPIASSAGPLQQQLETRYIDRLAWQMQLVKEDYGLSTREAEVAELIARGETVARIAEMLYVSENTVRTHSKRIYAKLDIHKKQQLRDLANSYEV